MNKYKKLLKFAVFLLISSTIIAFDWPQKSIDTQSIASYFGQKRGAEISKSIIFSDPSEIRAVENGNILIHINQPEGYSDFFPCTLGSSVILSHEDNLLSVYGNLNTESMFETLADKKEVLENDLLAITGNTGWQNGRSNLEFQILDKQSKAAVNPKLFLPRADNELNLYIGNICLINKTGDFFYLDLHNTLNSGIYKVYMKRNSIASPYKTSVSINGVTGDQISYAHINMENGKLYVNGKKKYTYNDIYPNNDLLLLGEVTLPPGKSSLGLTVEDFNGKVTRGNYTLNILN